MKKEKTNRPKQPMNRRKKYLLLSGTTTLLIVVALVLVNLLTIYITDRYPVSIDLTPQKVFGLTEQSKEYLSKLEQPVSIQVMTNEDTFIASGDYYVQANQVIQEYEKYSDQISLEYVDLLQNPRLASQYEDVQIGDIIVSSGNRTQTLTAYDLFNLRHPECDFHRANPGGAAQRTRRADDGGFDPAASKQQFCGDYHQSCRGGNRGRGRCPAVDCAHQ